MVKQVGEVKRRRRETFHVPGRERAVLERLTAAANGAFPREAVRPVFREIMSACLSLESPLVVAYPGPEATFSHLAGKTRFGLSARFVAAATLGEVFREIGRGADYGVVPVEEASEGLVTHALDYFIDSDLLIVGEIVIEIAHALLTRSGQTAGVERVYAHPAAAARCAAGPGRGDPRRRGDAGGVGGGRGGGGARRRALGGAGTRAGGRSVRSRGRQGAARRRAGRRRALPGAGQGAAARRPAPTPPACSSASTTGPGAWPTVLDRLAAAGVNLRRIASRPTDRRGLRDLFFVDLDGHRSDPACRAVLETLATEVPLVKILGSYPRDVAGGTRA